MALDRREVITTGLFASLNLFVPPGALADMASQGGTAPNTITYERRGKVALIGINRPDAQNRIDPPTLALLGKAYYDYQQDPELRAAILFGHGPHFSEGLDVQAFAPLLLSGRFSLTNPGTINPLQTSAPRLTKPVVGVAHGNTFLVGHELFLATDVRVAAQDATFRQAETSFAVFPGGGATIRFPREAGWAQAMRYILTGDPWGADEARRMSLVSEIAPTADAALTLGTQLATKIAEASPLGTEHALASAHQAIDGADD